MQTNTVRTGRKHRAHGRSPLGFLIAPLLAGRTTVDKVLARYFDDTGMGKRLRRALRHGSLIDGKIRGPIVRQRPGGIVEREPAAIDRGLDHKVTRRMLACFLMLVEHMDPAVGAVAGRKLWQGGHARRLGLSMRRDKWNRLGGLREVQRYFRIFDRAEVLCRTQPNADHVPEHMKARAKVSGFKGGVQRAAQWAYNKIWTPAGAGLPGKVANILRRWRGEPVPKAIPVERHADRGPVSAPPPGLREWLATRSPGEPFAT